MAILSNTGLTHSVTLQSQRVMEWVKPGLPRISCRKTEDDCVEKQCKSENKHWQKNWQHSILLTLIGTVGVIVGL